MHHASGFDTVQPDVAADWSSVVKLKDELAVGGLAFFLFCQPVFAIRGELGDLPLLALVFAEVLDDEGLYVGNAEQTLTGGMDGEASEVAGNPAAVELFGDGGRGAAADEAVEDRSPSLRSLLLERLVRPRLAIGIEDSPCGTRA